MNGRRLEDRHICTLRAEAGELQIWAIDDFRVSVSVKNGETFPLDIVVRRAPKRRKKQVVVHASNG